MRRVPKSSLRHHDLASEWASWLQAAGAITAMALTIYLWRRSSARDSRQAYSMASVGALKLIETLVKLREGCDRRQDAEIIALMSALGELRAFLSSVRADLLPSSAVGHFFELRAIAAKGERTMEDGMATFTSLPPYYNHMSEALEKLRARAHDSSAAM